MLGLSVSKSGAGISEISVLCCHSLLCVRRDEHCKYTGAARSRKGKQERDRGGSSNPGSTPLLWGRDSGLDGTTANPGRAVLGISS